MNFSASQPQYNSPSIDYRMHLSGSSPAAHANRLFRLSSASPLCAMRFHVRAVYAQVLHTGAFAQRIEQLLEFFVFLPLNESFVPLFTYCEMILLTVT